MSDVSPRERLLALYQRLAQLQAFREAEDAAMTPDERAESDEVIAGLEAAARELKATYRLEIWTEEFAEALGRMVTYQKEAEALRQDNDHEGADAALQKAYEMSILCGLFIGEFTDNERDSDAEDSA